MSDNHLSRRRFVLAGTAATAGAAVLGSVRNIAAATADATSGQLAFTVAGEEFRFDTGVLRGTLCEGGKTFGLYPFFEAASGQSLAGLPGMGILSPYRLFTSGARFLPDARDWSHASRLLTDGTVEVCCLPDKEHPFELKAVYRLASPRAIDFRAEVTPQRDLPRFELFLSSYFSGFSTSLAYVQHTPGAGEKSGVVEATKQAGDWQMFPRDEEAVRTIADGRWNYPPNPVAWKIRSCLAAPLALRRDVESGLTVVLVAPAKDCFAVSMPYGEESHRSVYLSLFGRDLKAGETGSAHVRLVIGKAISDQQAIELYEAYQNEPK